MMKKWGRTVLLSLVAILLSGCFFRAPDDLYQLPQRSAGYKNLDQSIKTVRSYLESESGSSSEYAVIFSGENTSTIQLQDLDGDGARETAITFLRFPSAEKPIKICFFTRTGEDDFTYTGLIEGEGSAIYAVDYADLNGLGEKEIVVSWQLGTGLYQLGAYTLDEQIKEVGNTGEGQAGLVQIPGREELLATQLLLASYSRYNLQDINQDQRMEIVILRLNQSGNISTANVYGWRSGALVSMDTAILSNGITSLDASEGNYVVGEPLAPALYVSCTLADGTRATDILTYQDEKLTNLTLNDETGISREAVLSNMQVELTDIDRDGILEIPTPIPLKTSDGNSERSSTDFWLIEWGKYNLSGKRSTSTTTYHNHTDGWYLEIQEDWTRWLSISRNDRTVGQREVVFSRWMGENREPERLLAVYKLTGPNRSAWATASNRFILREDDDTIYAAALYEAGERYGMDEAQLRENFHLITRN